ncbi:MAG: hypothetical protein RIB58_07720 [Phycisphaerales bacterium]
MVGPADEDRGEVARWLEVAARPEVADRLAAVYQMIADQVEARAPVCVASGRCCNFESYGHRLYVTGLEAAWCVLRLEPSMPALTPEAVLSAEARGGCPFQVGQLCGVHTIKPVGCRTYFCDPTAQDWQEALTERAHAMVRALHVSSGAPYRYMEWRAILRRFAEHLSTSPASG